LIFFFSAGVKNKSLKQSKGTGASGSFKIGEVVKPKKKPAASWTISVYDADADLLEDTYKNIYKF
jgi:hypothetical protein